MQKRIIPVIIALLILAGCNETGTAPAESSVTTAATTAAETPVEPVIADIPGTGYSCTVTPSRESSTDLTITVTESDFVIWTVTVSAADD